MIYTIRSIPETGLLWSTSNIAPIAISPHVHVLKGGIFSTKERENLVKSKPRAASAMVPYHCTFDVYMPATACMHYWILRQSSNA